MTMTDVKHHRRIRRGLSQAAVRSFAKRRGYIVLRCRHEYVWNFGGYALLRSSDDTVVCGVHYSATLEQIRAYLDSAHDLGPLP